MVLAAWDVTLGWIRVMVADVAERLPTLSVAVPRCPQALAQVEQHANVLFEEGRVHVVSQAGRDSGGPAAAGTAAVAADVMGCCGCWCSGCCPSPL